MVRRGHLMAIVGTFLIGCAILLVAGCAGVRSEAPQEQARSPEPTTSEEGRCGETRSIDLHLPRPWNGPYTTNDVPGCPNGGLLSGTDGQDKLYGREGEDEIHGLGAKDLLFGGLGKDVIYGGPGNDFMDDTVVQAGPEGGNVVAPDKSNDVLYGGPGNDDMIGDWGEDVLYGGEGSDRLTGVAGEDVLYGGDGNDTFNVRFNVRGRDGQDKLYCGEGTDRYLANEADYVDSSCEKKGDECSITGSCPL